MHLAPHAPQLEAFFEQHVQPRLAALEHRRRTARKALAGLVALPILLFIATIALSLPTGIWIGLAIVLGAPLLVLTGMTYNQFRDGYKTEIVTPLMKNLDAGAVYEPEGTIPEEHVLAARFLPESSSYECEDVVRGHAHGAPYELGNIHLKTGGGKSTRTLFQGLFFQASDSRPRRGTTVVIPWGWDHAIEGEDDPPAITFDDERIDEMFEGYTTDPAEGRAILTPAVMTVLADLADLLDTDVFASFSPGKVSVAAKLGDIFEPGLSGPLVKLEDVTRIGTLFATARSLAGELGATGGGHFAHGFGDPARATAPGPAPAAAPAPPRSFTAQMSDSPSLQPLVERLRVQGIGVTMLGQSSLTLDYGVRGKMWFSLAVSGLWTLLGLAVLDRATAWPAGGTFAQPLVEVVPLADVALAWLARYHPWTSWTLLALLPLGLFNAHRQYVRRVELTPQQVARVGGLLPGARTRTLAPGGTVVVTGGMVFLKGRGLGTGISPPLQGAIAEDVAALVAGFRQVPRG